ncbi:MAG: efflux RND transporter permease subunit [Candidatus Omnitrophica bacterium]|nr:efflux RND transporter permease subunit [Candidatus Omnitrophota bacterium]
MERFMNFVLRQRIAMLGLAAVIVFFGVIAWKDLPIDAFPDVTNVQVMVLTQAPGLAPAEVERLISLPLERGMNGLPGVRLIRSLSKAGLSQVVVVFEDDTDIYFARQVVFERIQSVRGRLPSGCEPEMGPVSTGLGEIFQYTVDGPDTDRSGLRDVQDWTIRPKLVSIPGVTEVNSFGGMVKQYQVIVDPDKLSKYGIKLEEVEDAIASNNSTAPANYIVRGEEQIVVRSNGLLTGISDIEDIVVVVRDAVPVLVRDLASVRIGSETRWGAVTRDGKGETVCGMVIMLKDANAKTVVERVKNAIKVMGERLPPGIRINPFYDRTELINACISTVVKALEEGAVLVILVLFLFLGDMRTASVVCLSLPLSCAATFIMMRFTGMSANLMSLGGLVIALGMVVDAGVVISENIYRHITEKHASGHSKIAVCRNAMMEVARPVMFATLITIVTKAPLFSLQAIEGKMFKPLAWTLIFAMSASLFSSLTIIPAAASYFIRGGRSTEDNIAIRWAKNLYLPVLRMAIRRKRATIMISVAVLFLSVFLFRFVGTEFLPYLDEGAIALNVVKLPTVSLNESVRIGETIERLLLEFPEVSTVVTKTGRAEIAEDPMGPEQNDLFIMLKPKKFWKARSKATLIEAMDKKLGGIPGVKLNFSQPIALRVNELISGIKSDVAVKIFGYDLGVLENAAEEIEHVISGITGAHDVKAEQVSGFLQLDIDIDRAAIARYGVNVSDVNEIVETAVGGKTVGTIFEEDRSYSLAVRFSEDRRSSEQDISNILIPARRGENVPLAQLAKVRVVETPNQISRESGMRRVVVECNVRGRDIGRFIEEARRKLAGIEKALPAGYFISWGGQFENQERAMRTLSLVVPVVAVMIFALLFMSFGSLRPAALVMLNLPFSVVGGIFTVVLFRITLSVSAVVGFITLFGIAVSNAIVLVEFFTQLRKQGIPLYDAVIRGCEVRLRPLIITSVTTVLGLAPILWANGPGSEIQKPLAAVVIGGLIASLALTLIVLPSIYVWAEELRRPARHKAE